MLRLFSDAYRCAWPPVLAHLREFTVELAEFDDNDKITGGLVAQIKELVLQYLIPVVCVEVNGPGSFAGKLLHQALKGNGCGGQEDSALLTNRNVSSMRLKRHCRRGSCRCA